jgi:hypothetical protein
VLPPLSSVSCGFKTTVCGNFFVIFDHHPRFEHFVLSNVAVLKVSIDFQHPHLPGSNAASLIYLEISSVILF